MHRVNNGEYLNEELLGSVADEFTERQNEVTFYWAVSGRSTLNARVAWLDRQHPDVPGRDFKAAAGGLGYVWTASGKSQLGLTLQRDVFASLDPAISRTQRDIVSLTPVWQATAKVAIRGQFGRIRTAFLASQVDAATRRDDIDYVEAGIDWRVTRNLAFLASVRDERRSSTEAGLDFRAVVSRFSGSLTF
jgi:hypothetical protein